MLSHPSGMAVRIEEDSDFRSEGEVLIAASTGFKVVSVTYADASIQLDRGGSISLRIHVMRLSYFLHWSDFDLDQHPPPVFV
jgi:hypothetical protein